MWIEAVTIFTGTGSWNSRNGRGLWARPNYGKRGTTSTVIEVT